MPRGAGSVLRCQRSQLSQVGAMRHREQLSSLLKNYNSYYSDQENLQLTYNQQEGNTPFIEGILSIFWGVRHPIRFKIQDEKLLPSFVTLKSAESVGLFPGKRGMTRWGEFDDLHHISGETLNSAEEQPDLEPGHQSRAEQDQDCATLPRTSSDAAALRRRSRLPTAGGTHRASINGHFYNHETSVFTPAFGSETKIRTNSHMRTRHVIEQLLRKFKIENSPHEFALYIIHASGEKKQLRSGDVPLLHRLLQGPSEKVAKFFLMDGDVEEISSDVAQYIPFHIPFLESILHRINEEEEQEIQQTVARYLKEKTLIRQHLRSRTVRKTETTV
ncbi:Ras association domain-containing protein 6 [Willisornis vidua]|uniref:Ras association domain-containing protein 6 n=1 Tax=Willisornis vidua TaxID=1566151 RepID=A0ABQ9D053_9PASS|nr:Ras association domain-containing protein 6 [Willisornis vidua]